MSLSTLLVLIVCASVVSYVLGRSRSMKQADAIGGVRHLDSLPFYYGSQAALWSGLPCLLLLLLWISLDNTVIRMMILQWLPEAERQLPQNELDLLLNTIENVADGNMSELGQSGTTLSAADRLNAIRQTSQQILTFLICSSLLLFGTWGWLVVKPAQKARNNVERAFMLFLQCCSTLAIFTTVGIVFSVLFESLRFFNTVPLHEFVFGTQWSPQIAIREDQIGGSGAFGAVPLFVGTLLISALAMVVAVPAGLMAAIYLSEYASRRVREIIKPLLEILAGIPTVVYGVFAALTVAPLIRNGLSGLNIQLWGSISIGPLEVSSESALAAGLVMGIMIIPFVSSLSDDVINAVPQSLRDGSYGLGATKSETIKKVVFPAALPGIVGGVLLAVSRAIGETMIVVMAAGLAANLTANPLESVTTVTVQIVTLLVGDQEFDSPKTLSAFALGLMLFVSTLILNIIALHVVKKYREHYE